MDQVLVISYLATDDTTPTFWFGRWCQSLGGHLHSQGIGVLKPGIIREEG
jgi:hypothetical protein